MATYKVLVTQQPDNRYTARALIFPDVVSSGANEAEAIYQLQKVISDIQSRSHIVEITLPGTSTASDDPWLPFIGIWKDDPDWDIFQEEVAAYRAEIDAKFAPE